MNYSTKGGPDLTKAANDEIYALDAKLDLPATATRDDLLKAMEGHVIGKAAYTGRFHAQPQ